MNTYIKKLVQRREVLIKELHLMGNMVSGSFFERKVQGINRYCLSRMVEKKQKQVYVSAGEKEQIQKGVTQHKRALNILQELGEINLGLIKKGVKLDDV